MSVLDLYYFTPNGLIGFADTPDDPYYSEPGISETGLEIANSPVKGIRWKNVTNHTTANVEKQFQGSGRAQVSPDRNYVIVVVSGSDYPWPRNALVFNSDGSLRRVVEPPDYIEHITFSGQLRKFKPEGFRSVHIKDGRVVLGIFFNHDWYQERFFDPATGIWRDVVVSGRH